MIIYLEATNMIIKRLEIKGLHGAYDYNVKFNDDLTFIYGENGCGKTTILDIVSSIVTGKIYNLFNYRFRSITLFFREGKKGRLNHVSIKSSSDSYEMSIDVPQMQETIEDTRKHGEPIARDDDQISYDRRFISRYEIPRFLREAFNYIYLPLSRNSQDGIDISEQMAFYRRRAMLYAEKDLVNKNYLNYSLRYVEEIIRTGYMRISSAENSINAQFRSNIFTSSLKVTSEYDSTRLLTSIKSKETIESIEHSQAEYIRILKSIGEWNEDTSKRVDVFFKKYKAAYKEAQGKDGDGHYRVTIEFLLMNLEFNRINEIAALAQKIETEKERIRTPITSFLSTVNSFFAISEDKKHIGISDEGKIFVEAENPSRKLSLYNLSSGEKQIIIIFACLIFGLPSGKSGIYIIDEPEASLHLAWQKKFVEAIQSVNNSIQLIFATHSPEIIGRFSDHAYRLQKKVDVSAVKEVEIYDE